MTKLCAVSFCFVLAIVLVGGESLLDSASIEITRQFPSFVLIEVFYSGEMGYPSQYCGGILINEQHVLTSGACVRYDNLWQLAQPTDIVVHFDFSHCDHALPVSKIYTFPDYTGNEFEYDKKNIAILKLGLKIKINESNRSGVAPAKISFSSYKEWKSCAYLNLKSYYDGENFKYSLNKTIFATYDESTNNCGTPNPSTTYQRHPEFCANPSDRGLDFCCEKDKGSALFCNDELIGIYLYGSCNDEDAGKFAKMPFYWQLILNTIEQSRNEDTNYSNSAFTSTVSVLAFILSLLVVLH